MTQEVCFSLCCVKTIQPFNPSKNHEIWRPSEFIHFLHLLQECHLAAKGNRYMLKLQDGADTSSLGPVRELCCSHAAQWRSSSLPADGAVDWIQGFRPHVWMCLTGSCFVVSNVPFLTFLDLFLLSETKDRCSILHPLNLNREMCMQPQSSGRYPLSLVDRLFRPGDMSANRTSPLTVCKLL